ncbi:hypothetical protein ACE6H2_015174 [Prunus campanulata]
MELDLSSNSFGGQIPWSLFLNLESLVYLNLGDNNYVGQFPEVDSNSTTISSLYDFSKQQLVGPIPRHLTDLYLYENQLNGTIPSWLGSLPSLKGLRLSSNQLSEFTRAIVEDLSNGRSPEILIDRFRNYCTKPDSNCYWSSDLPILKETLTLRRESHLRRLVRGDPWTLGFWMFRFEDD